MPDCWLTLDDELSSRYHARLYVTEAQFEVEDLASRNGTYVNGQRVEGRIELRDGDRLRIGREVIAVLAGDEDAGDDLRRTLAPGEDTQVPNLIGQLVEKSLKAGKVKDAERYALALGNQLTHAKVPVDHPTGRSCVKALIGLAERTNSGVWIDRVFKLHAAQRWVMPDAVLQEVLACLDRIPRVPGSGIGDYEQTLRAIVREGGEVPANLAATIGELADAYGRS